jgi:signal transduction histidine kinase
MKEMKQVLKRNIAFLFFMFLFSCKYTYGQLPKDTLVIDASPHIDLHKHLFIYQSSYNAITPQFILDSVKTTEFQKLFPKYGLDVGRTEANTWLCFTVKNTLHTRISLYYLLNDPQINFAKAFIRFNNQVITIGASGDHILFYDRPYKYSDIVFPFELDSGETKTIALFIQKHSEEMECVPELLKQDEFIKAQQNNYMACGIFTGVLLSAFIINLFLYAFLKDKIHLLYGCYVIALLSTIYTMNGFDFQFIYPNIPYIADLSTQVSITIALTLNAHVLKEFLHQQRSNSKFYLWINIFEFLIAGACITEIMIYSAPQLDRFRNSIDQAMSVLIILQLLMFSASTIEKVLQKFKPALFYLAALVYLWFSAVKYGVYIIGGDYDIIVSPLNIDIGITIEILIILLGIMYRYKLFKSDNEKLSAELQREQMASIGKILVTQEAEQKRIAEDLHDELGSQLAAIKMILQNSDYAKEQKSLLIRLLDKASSAIRSIAHNLMPPGFDNTDLNVILQNFYQQLNTDKQIEFNFLCHGYDKKYFSKHKELLIYRIVMELTTNIIKHSGASEATIQLIYDDLLLEVIAEDNGKGFIQDVKKSMGLKNIQHRITFLKGTILIDSGIKGSTIISKIPYADD